MPRLGRAPVVTKAIRLLAKCPFRIIKRGGIQRKLCPVAKAMRLQEREREREREMESCATSKEAANMLLWWWGASTRNVKSD